VCWGASSLLILVTAAPLYSQAIIDIRPLWTNSQGHARRKVHPRGWLARPAEFQDPRTFRAASAAALTLAKKSIRTRATPPTRCPHFEYSGKRVLFQTSEYSSLVDSALVGDLGLSSAKSSLAKTKNFKFTEISTYKINDRGAGRTRSGVPDWSE
jgi:hypothetical protein